jgi:MoxR-like ATPase
MTASARSVAASSPTAHASSPSNPQAAAQAALQQLGTVILGKPQALRLALVCLLARGHLLIEDVPGVGKTTLALALAQTLGLDFRRVQFTSDLLPSDILGGSVFERQSGSFRFHQGPIFSQLLLADEINRATPKTQSALLEAMEERQVSIDGERYPLPAPFFVIATQNPLHQLGTYGLPESQLDRFLFALSLGYPSPEAERQLLVGNDRREQIAALPVTLGPALLAEAQQQASQVQVAPPLLDYLQALLAASRNDNSFALGLSPRAGLGLLAAARAWAWLRGRALVLPEDVQAVFGALAGHRLLARSQGGTGFGEQTPIKRLLERVAIP